MIAADLATPSLRDDPAYRAAADHADRIKAELDGVEAELEAIDATARASGGFLKRDPLRAALAALDGGENSDPATRRIELLQRQAVMRRALPDARAARDSAAAVASGEYMKTQAPRVAEVLAGLVDAFGSLVKACEAFEPIRRDALALGFDPGRGDLPIGAESPFIEYAQHWFGQLRKEHADLHRRLPRV